MTKLIFLLLMCTFAAREAEERKRIKRQKREERNKLRAEGKLVKRKDQPKEGVEEKPSTETDAINGSKVKEDKTSTIVADDKKIDKSSTQNDEKSKQKSSKVKEEVNANELGKYR